MVLPLLRWSPKTLANTHTPSRVSASRKAAGDGRPRDRGGGGTRDPPCHQTSPQPFPAQKGSVPMRVRRFLVMMAAGLVHGRAAGLSLIHISEPTRLGMIS